MPCAYAQPNELDCLEEPKVTQMYAEIRTLGRL